MQKLLAASLVALFALAGPAHAQSAPLDDGDQASLVQSLDKTIAYLKTTKKRKLTLAGREVTAERLLATAERFKAIVEADFGTPRFESAVKAEFEWVSMPGTDGAGSVHFTGYHLPLLEARDKPDAEFRFPLYAAPDDLVHVDLGAFRGALAGQKLIGRLAGGRLVPYHSRAEIDDGRALAGRGLELAWVKDEMARYSLMVQGSGLLKFADGRVVNANFAAQNGHVYSSLGKALAADGKLDAKKLSMPAIEAFFQANPAQLRPYLNRNASYVFFRLAPDGPFGCDGISLTAGRAIATDKRLFPSGAIAHLEYPRAAFDAKGGVKAWEPGARFVVDQDTGGAILGPGRIDIYWGGGDEAARRAGTLNGRGRASYLLLREP